MKCYENINLLMTFKILAFFKKNKNKKQLDLILMKSNKNSTLYWKNIEKIINQYSVFYKEKIKVFSIT